MSSSHAHKTRKKAKIIKKWHQSKAGNAMYVFLPKAMATTTIIQFAFCHFY
jgi:hypothetical protein